MKLQVLDRIHEGHQGIVNCGEPAKTSVWWPGLSCEVQEWQKIANFFAEHRQQRAEPLMPTPFPERPGR